MIFNLLSKIRFWKALKKSRFGEPFCYGELLDRCVGTGVLRLDHGVETGVIVGQEFSNDLSCYILISSFNFYLQFAFSESLRFQLAFSILKGEFIYK